MTNIIRIVPWREVCDLLYQIAMDNISIELTEEDKHRLKVYGCLSSTVIFKVNGYTVELFIDGDKIDYVQHVIAPDGREGDFDDWTIDNNYNEPYNNLLLLQDKLNALFGN